MAERSAAAARVRNPFPGLRPFRTDEEHLFFGRENQVDRMIDKLAGHRFLAVVGTSGSGKSSLVNCGLRPALHRGYMASAGSSWRMAQFRPGGDPVGGLAKALSEPGVLFDGPSTGGLAPEKLVDATLRLGSLGLVDIVQQARLAPGTQVLVVVDQFEEIFRYRALVRGADAYSLGEDAVALVRLLLEARAQADVPIHVVLTMRSDFLGDCTQFHGLPEAINEGQYLVPRLTRDEIRAAIIGPVGVAAGAIDPVLVTRLLNDVGENPDQLSILQHALNRTWAHWEHEGQEIGALNLPHYEAIGGMARALDQHAEKAFSELGTDERRRIGERVFKALTDKGTDARGIRRPTKLATLRAITGAAPDDLQAVLAAFRKPSRSFLMPPASDDLTDDAVIDISHESLMRVWQRLNRWADEEAQSTQVYKRLRETAALYDAGRTNLWRDPELSLALDWRATNRPTSAWADQSHGGFDSAMAFLDKSRDAREAERIEADIERRWLAGWSYLPLAMVAVPFIFAQDAIAQSIGPIAQWVGDQFRRSPEAGQSVPTWAVWLSHLLAGIPAALGYMVLAPYTKRRFREWALSAYREEGRRPAELTTPAPAPIVEPGEMVYSGFGRRAGAQIVDWLILLVPSVVTLGVLFASFEAMYGAAFTDGQEVDGLFGLAIMVSLVLMYWLYHVLSWTSSGEATPGMRALGIFVTNLSGRRVSRSRATGRFFARFLSYYTVGVGFLMQAWSDKRQTLHDRLSGTVVLRRTKKRGVATG